MSYVRWSSPIPLPLTCPCPTCGRRDVRAYPGDEWERGEACDKHQMRWINGPWWRRVLRRLVWLVFGRHGTLTGRPSRWLSVGWLSGRGFCPDCTSGWYVYWDIDGRLAVWAARVNDLPMYTYEEVRDIVDSGDYARIPGFDRLGDQGVLAAALKEFLVDYENERAAK